MFTILRPAAVLLGLFTLLTGVVYPFVVTGAAAVIFPEQASGSLLKENGRVIGSKLIGQPFDAPNYFWPRPSATSPHPYQAGASTGSNLGPTNPALAEAISARVAALRAADPENQGPVPIDLVTSSGSGLDPNISPAAALYQVQRVALARRLSETAVKNLVFRMVEERTFGVLGEPRVNVLALNRALDALSKSGT